MEGGKTDNDVLFDRRIKTGAQEVEKKKGKMVGYTGNWN